MKDNSISFAPFPTIQTERLTLRRLEMKDASNVYFLRTDAQVNKYIKRPLTADLEAAKEFINKINKGIDDTETIYWPITISEQDEMIGAISLWHFSEDKKIAEVGYDLKPKFQGRGYMSEALRAVINYGFEKLYFDVITAYTHKDNRPSIKLLSNHGFSLNEGEVDSDNENNIIFELKKKP